jgi:glycosyltransferase involved in cell wall biosynthesis
VRDRVDLAASVLWPDDQLRRLDNVFKATVLPGVGEGFGLPIIESLAAGVPVVATDCSACSALVRGRGLRKGSDHARVNEATPWPLVGRSGMETVNLHVAGERNGAGTGRPGHSEMALLL